MASRLLIFCVVVSLGCQQKANNDGAEIPTGVFEPRPDSSSRSGSIRVVYHDEALRSLVENKKDEVEGETQRIRLKIEIDSTPEGIEKRLRDAYQSGKTQLNVALAIADDVPMERVNKIEVKLKSQLNWLYEQVAINKFGVTWKELTAQQQETIVGITRIKIFYVAP